MENELSPETRQAAVTGLAIVGFITLAGAGMYLAVYASRFVPAAIDRVGAAAVYVGSILIPAQSPSPALTVVPDATSTVITFPETAETAGTAPVATSTPKTPAQKPQTLTPGTQTSGVYALGSTTPATPTLSGLPDLTVTVDAVGYLATTSANSFVASSTVPHGSRPAITFTVKNVGTNVSGPWRFSATIPTTSAYTYGSEMQQSLNPGDKIQYTLGFDQATSGANQPITITVNPDHAVAESNTTNDTVTVTVTVLGS